jgi:hypothetical protein
MSDRSVDSPMSDEDVPHAVPMHHLAPPAAAASAVRQVYVKMEDTLPSNQPLYPTLHAPPNASPSLLSALSLATAALQQRASYAATVQSYETFLRTKMDLSMMHGATPAFQQLVVAQQLGLKRDIPFELVYAHSEREGEISACEEIYRALNKPIPQVTRARVFMEPVKMVKRGGRPPNPERFERVPASAPKAVREVEPKSVNPGIAEGSIVRTIFGQTDMKRYREEAENNPLLNNTDRASAYAEAGTRTGNWSSLAVARSTARRNGSLLPSFPLVYSAFVSSLGTWLNAADLAARTRIKENPNFIVWVECFGYELPKGEEDFDKLADDVKKDLENQWKDFVWRGLFPPPRMDMWNRHLKREKLRVERDHDNRRIRMVPMPGWVRLPTDPPEDMTEDSPLLSQLTQQEAEAAPADPAAAAAAPPAAAPEGLAQAAATLQSNPQMMLLMQQMLLQQQLLRSRTFIPNHEQQRDVVIDETDTIDGDMVYVPDQKFEAQVEARSDASDILPVTIPCPFLPVTISKIGSKSMLYLILYAHLERFVSGETIMRLAKYHFPSSWDHFFAVMTQRYPPLAMNPPAAEKLFERHLVMHVLPLQDRNTWSEKLALTEGIRIEAVTGDDGSFFRLVRQPGFIRPSGTLALGDRLMASLRVPAVGLAVSETTPQLTPQQNVPQQVQQDVAQQMPSAVQQEVPQPMVMEQQQQPSQQEVHQPMMEEQQPQQPSFQHQQQHHAMPSTEPSMTLPAAAIEHHHQPAHQMETSAQPFEHEPAVQQMQIPAHPFDDQPHPNTNYFSDPTVDAMQTDYHQPLPTMDGQDTVMQDTNMFETPSFNMEM